MAMAHVSEPLLVVEHLSRSFDGVDAVRDVSFAVAPGEIVAMIGPNGAGKTTCFNLIHGELRPDAGNIRFDRRSLVDLPTHEIAHRGIGRTFQMPATFASMMVREAVALSIAAHEQHDARLFDVALADRAYPVDQHLSRLHISDIADAHCGTLAYGEAKRLEIALALGNAPRLLLMDEPTAGMDQAWRRRLMARVIELARPDNVSILFTEHDMDIVFCFAERIIVLDRGEIIAHGPADRIRNDPRVQAAYLGEVAGNRRAPHPDEP